MEQCINQRTTVIADRKENTFIPMLQDNETENYNYQLITPIISEGDVMGAVIFLSQDKKMGELEGKLAINFIQSHTNMALFFCCKIISAFL